MSPRTTNFRGGNLTEIDKSKKSYPLIRAIGSLLFWPFIGTIFPRIVGLTFTYSITFVMGAAINYLERPSDERDTNYAYGLIAATLICYSASSVSADDPLLIDADI